MKPPFLRVVCFTFCLSFSIASQPAFANEGACTNEQDAAVGKPAMEAKELVCGKKCLGGKECTSKCMSEELGLTPACADCWGEVAACGKKHCWLPCMGSPTGKSCRECAAKNGCNERLDSCVGI